MTKKERYLNESIVARGANSSVVATRATGWLPGALGETVALDGEVQKDDGHLFAGGQRDVELKDLLGFPQRVIGVVRRRVVPCEKS